ncbi:MAG: hypothetical protein KAU31_17415, partial [Spirochaetaceae bacterium]|nr:hypothetical protein [Spirochaetaceae bacterium]
MILTTVALLVVNMAVVPGIIARMETRLGDLCQCEVRVDSARYVPLRGIVLRTVVLDGASAVEFRVARLRARVPLALVRRREDPPVPYIKPWNAASVLWSVLADADATGVLPRRVLMDNVSIVMPAWNGSSVILTTERVEMLHDSRSATVSITGAGSSEAALVANIQIGYGQKTLSGELEIRALPLAFDPITAGEFSGSLSFRSGEEDQFNLAGTVKFHDVTLELPTIADEPIPNLDIRYDFAATFNPRMALPLQYRQYPVFPPAESPKGQLIFSAGDLEVNQIRL